MDIGFIGLGKMGFPMARRLIEAKHQLVVFDQRKEAVDKLVALGAQAAELLRRAGGPVREVISLRGLGDGSGYADEVPPPPVLPHGGSDRISEVSSLAANTWQE